MDEIECKTHPIVGASSVHMSERLNVLKIELTFCVLLPFIVTRIECDSFSLHPPAARHSTMSGKLNSSL